MTVISDYECKEMLIDNLLQFESDRVRVVGPTGAFPDGLSDQIICTKGIYIKELNLWSVGRSSRSMNRDPDRTRNDFFRDLAKATAEAPGTSESLTPPTLSSARTLSTSMSAGRLAENERLRSGTTGFVYFF